MTITKSRIFFLTIALLTVTRITEASFLDTIKDTIFGFDNNEEEEDDDVEQYIVTFRNQQGRLEGIQEGLEFLLDLDKINAIVVKLTPRRLEKLRKNPNIQSIQIDQKLNLIGSMENIGSSPQQQQQPRQSRRLGQETTTTNTAHNNNNQNEDHQQQHAHRKLEQTVPYGVPMVQADQVSYDGSHARKVCIIDTGYLTDHEDLPKTNVDGFNGRGRRRLLVRLLLRFFPQWGQQALPPWDVIANAHGSHVAGTIAAISNNNLGIVGVSPGVELYIVNAFLNPEFIYESGLVRAIGLCQDSGANIINMSLGRIATYSELLFEENGGAQHQALKQAYDSGMLIFAAAGNENTTLYSLPASFDSVISVAAVDEKEEIAFFSNKNERVELSAPGVRVLSAVDNAPLATLKVNINTNNSSDVRCTSMEGSSQGEAVGELEFCGLGTGDDVVCNPTGKVCLIERGEITFAEKVTFCEDNGAIGTIVYNNVPGDFAGTLGDFYRSKYPAVSVTAEDGDILRNSTALGTEVRLLNEDSVYAYLSGTSMACPHAAGVAALVWSQHPTCTNVQIRQALQVTAKDLGESGKDDAYGYGLVQAKAAVEYLDVNSC